jgi:hypothetical protein
MEAAATTGGTKAGLMEAMKLLAEDRYEEAAGKYKALLTGPAAADARDGFRRCVERLFEKADEQIRQERLTSPAGNCATDTLARIRRLDPGNAGIAERLQKIARLYGTFAEKAQQAGRLDDARNYRKKAAEISEAVNQ